MADGTRAKAGSRSQSAAASAALGDGDEQHHGDNAGHSVADSAKQAMAEVKQAGSDLVGAVCDSAVSMLDTQRGRAADQIAAVGEALKRSAQSLDSTSGSAVVDYADRAAEQITGFAATVRDRPWGDLADDVEDFAQRWPLAFVASAIGIGFVAGRFMLSSAERTRDAKSSTPKKPATGGSAPLGATNPDPDQPEARAPAPRSRELADRPPRSSGSGHRP